MGSVSAVHWGHRNEYEGSACRWISRLQAAYRWWVLCFDDVGLLLYRHPQVLHTLWRDRCQTHATGYRITSVGMGRHEENHWHHQQHIFHPRHCITVLSGGRPPEPAGSSTVYRVLSIQRGGVVTYVKRRVLVYVFVCAYDIASTPSSRIHYIKRHCARTCVCVCVCNKRHFSENTMLFINVYIHTHAPTHH